jgi:pimeloyl-ACP methyl ester carboxylesterase
MFGHSLGGAAAAQALLQYPILRAGVDLDGTPSGTVVAEGLDEPFGIMLSNTREQDVPPGEVDVDLATFVSHLRGPHPLVHLSEIGHNGYTDFVVFNPQLRLVDPALGALLESAFDTDAATPAAGAAALSRQRRFLADFMSRYVHP